MDQGIIASLLQHPLASALVILDRAGRPIAANPAAREHGLPATVAAYGEVLEDLRLLAADGGLVPCQLPGGPGGRGGPGRRRRRGARWVGRGHGTNLRIPYDTQPQAVADRSPNVPDALLAPVPRGDGDTDGRSQDADDAEDDPLPGLHGSSFHVHGVRGVPPRDAELADVDVVVTDSGADPADLDELRRHGLEVVVA